MLNNAWYTCLYTEHNYFIEMTMYRELQKLDPQPFQDSIDTVFFFSGGDRRDTIDKIISTLSQSVPLLLLTGEEGAGKTMVCRMVEKELPPEMISVFMPQAINSFDDMANIVMEEIGLGLEDDDEQESDTAILLEKIVSTLHERDRRLVVFFDEAEKIYLATLERIRKLLDQVNEESIIFQCVFSGRQLFEDNLKQLSIVTFKDIEERRYTLRPLTEEESCSYLNHCMKIASGKDDAIFSRDLVSKVSSNGTNFKRLNHFALESFQSDQLDTSFLSLLDTIEDQPPSVTDDEKREREVSTPVRRREVNLEFLSFRKILPSWILFGGGASIIALLLFFLFDFSGDSEQPKDVTSEVPIIELKRVVPLNPPTAQDSPVEIEKTAELTNQRDTGGAEKPPEPAISRGEEGAGEKPAEQTDTSSAEKPPEQVISRGEEGAGEKPAEQADTSSAEKPPEQEISGVEVEAEKKPDLIEKKVTPDQSEEIEAAIPSFAEKSAEEGEDKGAEGTNNVLVEPLEETEKPFSADTIKQTRLPEPIVIIGDEKKFKESKQDAARVGTQALPAEDTLPVLTDKGVDALFLRRIAAGARWLVGGGSGKYTIQLMVLTSDQAEESLKKMLRTAEYQKVADHLYVLRRTGPDPTVMVFYGEYSNLAAARNSRNNLPVFLRKHHPYAISVFGAVEKATAPQ
jgi:type II secretory pathway predicted ATPase ExeA